MSRQKRFGLVAVVGVTLVTAYAFGRGPFGGQFSSGLYGKVSSPQNACTTGNCPAGVCNDGACQLTPSTAATLPSFGPGTPVVPAGATAAATPYQPAQPLIPATAAPVSPASVNALVNPTPAKSPRAAVVQDKPIGHWRRALGPMNVEWKGEGNLLSGSVTLPADENVQMKVDFVVEYSITRDGLLYGVIQSADIDVPNVPAGADIDDLLEAKFMATHLIDQSITMRCRVDNGSLTIKSFDLALPLELLAEGDLDGEMIAMLRAAFVGRYPSAVPVPAAAVSY